MAEFRWKIVMLCSSLLLGGCGDDDDTGDSRPVVHPEYGTWGVQYQPDEDAQPLPMDWRPSPERTSTD